MKILNPGKFFLVVIGLFLASGVISQSSILWGNLQTGKYAVGYKTVDAYDYSRSYLPQSPDKRPMPLSIWYPAVKGKKTMTVKDYYGTWKTAAIQFIDSGYYREKVNWLIRGYAGYNPRGSFNDSLLRVIQATTTAAYKDAAPVAGKFPLIICPGGSGDASTQSVRNEYWASQGYVVIAVPLLNQHAADFDRGDGAMASALSLSDDIGFVVNYAHQLPNVEVEKIAVVSMLMQSGLVYQFKTQKLKAVISFEDDMTSLRNIPYLNTSAITIPVMTVGTSEGNPDIRFLDSLSYAERYIMHLPGSKHIDIYQLEKVARPSQAGTYKNYEAMAEYMLHFLDYALKKSLAAETFIKDHTLPAGVNADKISFTYLPPVKPLMDSKDFLALLRFDQLERAKQIYTEAKQQQLQTPLFTRDQFTQLLLFERTDKSNDYLYEMIKLLLDAYPSAPVAERFLNIMGYQYMQQKNITKALELFKLNVTHFPLSPNSYDALADAYVEANDKDNAVIMAKKVLVMLDESNLDERTKQGLKQSAETKLKKYGIDIPVQPVKVPDFNKLQTGITENLMSIEVSNNNVIIAAGEKGKMIQSKDNGGNWSAISNGADKPISAIDFPSPERGYAVSPGNIILKTNNGGSEWKLLSYDGKDALICLSFSNEQTGCIGTGNGKILQTTNEGNNWSTVYENKDHFFRDISFVNTQLGFAAGGGGNASNGYGILLRTTDGGKTWNNTGVTLPSTLNSIFMLNDQVGYVAGYDGHILSTKDGGLSWQKQVLNGVRSFRKIIFSNPQQGYAVGDAGVIYQTTDAGITWKRMVSGVQTDLYGAVIHQGRIYIAGENGVILIK